MLTKSEYEPEARGQKLGAAEADGGPAEGRGWGWNLGLQWWCKLAGRSSGLVWQPKCRSGEFMWLGQGEAGVCWSPWTCSPRGPREAELLNEGQRCPVASCGLRDPGGANPSWILRDLGRRSSERLRGAKASPRSVRSPDPSVGAGPDSVSFADPVFAAYLFHTPPQDH